MICCSNEAITQQNEDYVNTVNYTMIHTVQWAEDSEKYSPANAFAYENMSQWRLKTNMQHHHWHFHPFTLLCTTFLTCFFCCLFFRLLFLHFIITPVACDLFLFLPLPFFSSNYYQPYCSHIPFGPPLFLYHCLILTLSIIHFLLSSHPSLSPPTLLHHSIFVLVQLQKWDSAVTNLLAKPPRAPCGGASSQRTRVIDWTWGKLCQAGHHDWISCLIINSLLPWVLLGDAGVMWRISMTHGALNYYGWSTLPGSTFSYTYRLTVFLLPWFHVPDPKPANTFFMRSVCVFRQGWMWEKKLDCVCVCYCEYVHKSVQMWKHRACICQVSKCATDHSNNPLLGTKPSVHIRWGLGRENGGITFIGKVSWQIDFLT